MKLQVNVVPFGGFEFEAPTVLTRVDKSLSKNNWHDPRRLLLATVKVAVSRVDVVNATVGAVGAG